MFGYVDIKKQGLSDGEKGLWQAFMCGLCFSTKKHFSNNSRLLVNNDINFFNILFHSFLEIDVEIVSQHCISHPFRKQTMQKSTDLTDKIAIANIILVYFNLYDDVLDGKSLKKQLAFWACKKDFKKAQALWGEFCQSVEEYYQQLRSLENQKTTSIDEVCHPFAQLSKSFCQLLLGENFNQTIGDLCYNIGKWIYLIDALDDIKHDFRKANYNAFVAYYQAKNIDFVTEKLGEIEFLMFAVLNRIAICYNDLNLKKYHCILQNVLFTSLREKTTSILSKYKKEKIDGLQSL